MPPRLQLLKKVAVSFPASHTYQPFAPFLYPSLVQQRPASILNSLSDTQGAYNKRIRRGRGPASGKGKTSGRGHKGQKQHGKVPTGFNGGQTPDHVVHGTRGFTNHFSLNFARLNLDTVQMWIEKGRLDPHQPITLRELCKTNCVRGVKDGVKLLARGKEELRHPIHIVVSRASAEAIEAVEKLGGSVTTRYYTNFAIRKINSGEMDAINSLQSRISFSRASPEGAAETADALQADRQHYRYRLPDPTSRKDMEYYRDPAHRGYLSHTIEEGRGPSLYFRLPGNGPKKVVGQAKSSQERQLETKLW